MALAPYGASMKSFPFVICLIVGLWVGYMFGINKPADSLTAENPPATAETAQAESAMSELESLRLKNLELSQRIEALEKELAALAAAK